MTKTLVFCMLLLSSLSLGAQVFPHNPSDKSDSTKTTKPFFNAFYPKLQYEYGNYNNISIGLGFVNTYSDMVIWRTSGPFVDLGLSFKDRKTQLSNKIGFEYYYLVFASRMNLMNTTDFQQNQVCFRPEVGFTLFTKLALMYGYNFNLNTKDHFGLRGHVLSINLGVI